MGGIYAIGAHTTGWSCVSEMNGQEPRVVISFNLTKNGILRKIRSGYYIGGLCIPASQDVVLFRFREVFQH